MDHSSVQRREFLKRSGGVLAGATLANSIAACAELLQIELGELQKQLDEDCRQLLAARALRTRPVPYPTALAVRA